MIGAKILLGFSYLKEIKLQILFLTKVVVHYFELKLGKQSLRSLNKVWLSKSKKGQAKLRGKNLPSFLEEKKNQTPNFRRKNETEEKKKQ